MEVGIEEDQMSGSKHNWQDCALMFYISELISVHKNKNLTMIEVHTSEKGTAEIDQSMEFWG